MTKYVQVNNEEVENYNITKFESKIVEIIVNTKEKWIQYYTSLFENQSCVSFHNKQIISDFTGLIVELYNEEVLSNTIEIDLKEYLTDSKRYIRLNTQEKNQIIIYLIPRQLLTNNKKLQEHYSI